MGTWSAAASAIVLGILLTVQVATNRRLGSALHSPLSSAAVSFILGLVGLLVVLAATRQWPRAPASATPWWAWTGGLMGAAYVAGTIVLLPRLGALALMGLVIGGQIAAALLIDHFAWLGVAPHPLSAARLVGAALLLIGVMVVLRG